MIKVAKKFQMKIHITCFKSPTLVLFFLSRKGFLVTCSWFWLTKIQIVDEPKSVTKEIIKNTSRYWEIANPVKPYHFYPWTHVKRGYFWSKQSHHRRRQCELDVYFFSSSYSSHFLFFLTPTITMAMTMTWRWHWTDADDEGDECGPGF